MYWVGRNEWTERADAIVLALQMYEDSLCSSCGQSAIHAFEPRNSGEFEASDETVCLGCEVIEQRDSDIKLPAGTKVYVQNHMSDD